MDRAAIRAATVSALAVKPAVALGEIKAVADVGRTTLNRYFPSRARLVHAATMESAAVVTDVVSQAVIDKGSTLDVVRRLVLALVPVGDHLAFLLGAPKGFENLPPEIGPPSLGTDLTQWGQREGVFGSAFSPQCVRRWLLTLLLTGCQEVSRRTMPLHTP
jgi:AcrR family transcriptional regulator